VTLLLLSLLSCASLSGTTHSRTPEPEVGPTNETGRAPVVVVTLDGVRWQEVFDGSDPRWSDRAIAARALMPNLHRLATERGSAVGAPGYGRISASGPHFVSLPGYMEILGGRSAVDCKDNDCPQTAVPTLFDDAARSGAKVAGFSSWERTARALTASPGLFPLSCGRAGNPAIDPSPGEGDYRPDALTADLALSYAEREAPDVLFLGLGDTDEYAHHRDYAGYLRAIQFADSVIGRLVALMDRKGDWGRRATIFVTADHGRSKDFDGHGAFAPESARVWLVAAGAAIRARGPVASPTDRRLADIAPTIRPIVGLGPSPRNRSGEPLAELFVP
jgi:hypothetical protein